MLTFTTPRLSSKKRLVTLLCCYDYDDDEDDRTACLSVTAFNPPVTVPFHHIYKFVVSPDNCDSGSSDEKVNLFAYSSTKPDEPEMNYRHDSTTVV